jgi:hypothetical protein
MEQPSPHPTEVAMERLRSQIALARQRLTQAERDLEERGWGMLVSETPIADHAYRVARDERARVRARLAELESALGRLILEREGFASDPASA